jgi:hypothetical protein
MTQKMFREKYQYWHKKAEFSVFSFLCIFSWVFAFSFFCAFLKAGINEFEISINSAFFLIPILHSKKSLELKPLLRNHRWIL